MNGKRIQLVFCCGGTNAIYGKSLGEGMGGGGRGLRRLLTQWTTVVMECQSNYQFEK